MPALSHSAQPSRAFVAQHAVAASGARWRPVARLWRGLDRGFATHVRRRPASAPALASPLVAVESAGTSAKQLSLHARRCGRGLHRITAFRAPV